MAIEQNNPWIRIDSTDENREGRERGTRKKERKHERKKLQSSSDADVRLG